MTTSDPVTTIAFTPDPDRLDAWYFNPDDNVEAPPVITHPVVGWLTQSTPHGIRVVPAVLSERGVEVIPAISRGDLIGVCPKGTTPLDEALA